MKKFLLIFIPIVVVAALALYFFSGFFFGASPIVSDKNVENTNNVASPPPVSTTAGKVSAAEGVIAGRARPAPGPTIDFNEIKVAIYDPNTGKELQSLFLGADGSYRFAVTAGEYVLDLVRGYGLSKHLPQRIYVGSGETLELNFQVGT